MRKHRSTKERARLFMLHGGCCHLCGGKIDGVREAWDISHDLPLELGGSEDDLNAKIAHRKCHQRHTAAVDLPTIAKAKRRAAKHDGSFAPRRQIQSRGFPKAEPQMRASRPLRRKSEEV